LGEEPIWADIQSGGRLNVKVTGSCSRVRKMHYRKHDMS